MKAAQYRHYLLLTSFHPIVLEAFSLEAILDFQTQTQIPDLLGSDGLL